MWERGLSLRVSVCALLTLVGMMEDDKVPA